MPTKRIREVPAIPDITDDPVERKRVLSILAQRRYRERKRQQWKALQAQVESHKDSNTRQIEASNSVANPESARRTLSVLDSFESNFPVAMDFFSSNSSDLEVYCPDATVELFDQTSSGFTARTGSADFIPESFSASHLLGMAQSCQLLSAATQSLSSPPASQDPFPSSSFATVVCPSQSEGNNPGMLQLASLHDNSSSLSDRLQDYQTSTFSFPDDHLLEIPSLKLLGAVMKVAERLNITDMLWDLSAMSPFYEAVTTPPSLVSSSSSSPDLTPCNPGNQAGDVVKLPRHLQPTISQRLIPHHPILDLLPWPSTRDKLIQVFNLPPAMRPKSARDPTGLLRLVYDMEDIGGEGIRVQGGDAFAVEAWEIGQTVFERWWWAFDGEIVARSDCARSLRGEKLLTMETSNPAT